MTTISIPGRVLSAVATGPGCGRIPAHTSMHRQPAWRPPSVAPIQPQLKGFSNPDQHHGSRRGRRPIRHARIRPACHVCARAQCLGLLFVAALAITHPEVALAGSPFATGANATQQQLVAILTPLAAVAVMVSGAMAWFGRLSWWWMVAVVIGTVLVFGGPQIVSWIRGLFGV